MNIDSEAEVTLTEAARQSGISERTLRRWVKAGKLPYRKVAVNYYLVNVADLPKISRPTIASLQRELQEARTEIARLKGLVYRPYDALSETPDRLASRKPVEVRSRAKPSERRYSSPGEGSGYWRHKSDAFAWLSEHGINMHTSKAWPDWEGKEVTELGKREVLQVAIDKKRNTRDQWKVAAWDPQRCSDPECPCREMLLEDDMVNYQSIPARN